MRLANKLQFNLPLSLQLFNLGLFLDIILQLLLLIVSIFMRLLILMVILHRHLRGKAFLLSDGFNSLHTELLFHFFVILFLIVFTEEHFARLELA